MAEENIIKMKRVLITQENIFANDTLDKYVISKIYKELIGLNTWKTNNPVKKMGKGPEETFLQGGHIDGPQTYEKNVQHHQPSERCKLKSQ